MAVLSAWVLLNGVDLYAMPKARGEEPLVALAGEVRGNALTVAMVDPLVQVLDELSKPGDVLLDLSATPLIHVLTGLQGVGGADLIMPGTFLGAEEEAAFLERAASASPTLVLLPRAAFDGRSERAVWEVAPQVFGWVNENFVRSRELRDFLVLMPRSAEVQRSRESSDVAPGER